MLPASKAPFPWLIVFFGEIESGFIWERGGCEAVLLRQVGSLIEVGSFLFLVKHLILGLVPNSKSVD